ncbi:MAG: DUF2207 domain-containing protein, partial [Anaerolineae bacterium]|nr:DUF2207 domain-containing protein [Anaerolineae bacterium]
MAIRRKWWALVVLVGMIASLWVVVPTQAQSQSLYWRRWDVTINNVDINANRFHVVETHSIAFTSGTFRYGYRSIPLDRVDQLTGVRVLEGEAPLREACTQQAGTYCATRRGEDLEIVYYFTRPAQSEERTFYIEYDVVGGLRSYEGGDQLDWYAIAPDHSFPITASTVTIQLPAQFPPREGVDPVVSYGAATEVSVNGSTIIYRSTDRISASQALEVRVQYPHNPDMVVASWQASFDQEVTWKPILMLFFIALGLVIVILGPALVYFMWYRRGRDPEVAVVPEYLAEPPSDIPPAIAGTLVDETADLQDIMSTLLDLAKRGYLIIEEDRQSGFLGLGSSTVFTFKRTDKAGTGLRRYEQTLLRKVFKGSHEATMDSLKNKFYTAIPQLQNELYDEVVDEGYFSARPDRVRQGWTGAGILLLMLAAAVGFFAFPQIDSFASTLICVPLALGVTAVALLAVANAMPAKTASGSQEAAKWRAFREYLRNVQRYTNLEEATNQFNEYLPYAVAFGLERAWVRAFSRLPSTPLPYWYYPVYWGGPWRHGYRYGGSIVDMRNPDIRS